MAEKIFLSSILSVESFYYKTEKCLICNKTLNNDKVVCSDCRKEEILYVGFDDGINEFYVIIENNENYAEHYTTLQNILYSAMYCRMNIVFTSDFSFGFMRLEKDYDEVEHILDYSYILNISSLTTFSGETTFLVKSLRVIVNDNEKDTADYYDEFPPILKVYTSFLDMLKDTFGARLRISDLTTLKTVFNLASELNIT